MIFHAGVGDLFVVRAAGHVADRSILASLEYATERLQVPLLVIMGHEACDVIGAAAQPSTAGATHLEYLLKAIKPSIDRVASEPAGTRTRSAILGHVEETINQMLESSSIVRGRAESGQLVIAGAYYEMSTGRVHFSDPVLVPPRPATRAASPAPAPRGTKPAAAASPRTSAPRAGK